VVWRKRCIAPGALSFRCRALRHAAMDRSRIRTGLMVTLVQKTALYTPIAARDLPPTHYHSLSALRCYRAEQGRGRRHASWHPTAPQYAPLARFCLQLDMVDEKTMDVEGTLLRAYLYSASLHPAT